MDFRVPLVSACALAASTFTAAAAGKIYYGSRAGMQVTVVSMTGLDTANAVIRTKHTREDATAFCRDYVGKVTRKCVDDEMATRLNDQITANCKTGVFTDFFGGRYRFAGKNKGAGDFGPKYRLIDMSTGEAADGSSASGYSTNMSIFKALCPMTAPDESQF